jgi:hypothetical protein
MGKRSRNLDGLYDIRRMDKIIRIELTAMGTESSLANKNCGCGHKILPGIQNPEDLPSMWLNVRQLDLDVIERTTMVVTE